MIKLGYSLGEPKPKYSLKERIDIALSVEKYALEISYGIADELIKERLDNADIEKIKQFEFVSIHAPVFISKDPKIIVKYPCKEGEEIIKQLLEIAKKINAKAILFHPDLVTDFIWLNEKIGKLLVFENMDINRTFGKTVADLKTIFTAAPNAKWACDVNHIYTLDKSMKLADDFHDNFKDKLCYYHLSGYGEGHDALYISQEDIILKGIKDFSVPIIDEGMALRDGLNSLSKENEYILKRLE